MNKISIKPKSELNQEIEKCCNLYLDSDNINISELKLWKMIGTLDPGDSAICEEDALSRYFSCLRLKYTAKGDIWLGDPFNIAIISLDDLDELAVFVSPDCSELYSINNYEDILELLTIEFLPKLKEIVNISLSVSGKLGRQGTTSISYPVDTSVLGNKIWYDGPLGNTATISSSDLGWSGLSDVTISSDNCMDAAVTITGNLTLTSDGNWKLN